MAIEAVIYGHRLVLTTSDGLFSPRRIDSGTLALLGQADLRPGDRVLDLGCGYGVAGLAAAKVVGPGRVVMVDRDPAAVACARANASANGLSEVTIVESDGFSALRGQTFTVILCNPPYHSDFAVPKRLIEGAFRHLDMGGRCLFVVKRRLWYEKKFRAVFGGVRAVACDPYCVLLAEKRSGHPPKREKTMKTTRKHRKKTGMPSQ